MSIMEHFLTSHLYTLPEDLGTNSDVQGKIFHQIMKVIEGLY